MKERIIEEFNYKLESDAMLDIFSTAGEEELNQDNFEVLTNKNLTILILADGEGRSTMGDILSEMASSQALEQLDAYQFDKKSPEEIMGFLETLLFKINDSIVEYIEVANLSDCSTTLSIALIYKNSLYTAHVGKSRIYVIHRDETATLLSKDPSYSKRLSKSSLSEDEKTYYLGDKSLDIEKILITHEADLHHKDTLFVCSNNILETIPENKFTTNIEEIETLLESNPPLENASFLRYQHYERSVEVLRVEKEELRETATEEDDYEKIGIDWENIFPLLKKIALALGILLILGFFYFLLNMESTNIIKEKPPVEEIPVLNSELPSSRRVDNLVTPTIEVIANKPIVKEESPIENRSTVEVKNLNKKTLKLLQKADSTVLDMGEDGIRITFKGDQLVGSQKRLFSEKDGDSHVLYCTLEGAESELKGEIVDRLKKQRYSNSVSLRSRGEEIVMRIEIKNNCSYTRSSWAEKSGLDLLTFTCE